MSYTRLECYKNNYSNLMWRYLNDTLKTSEFGKYHHYIARNRLCRHIVISHTMSYYDGTKAFVQNVTLIYRYNSTNAQLHFACKSPPQARSTFPRYIDCDFTFFKIKGD